MISFFPDIYPDELVYSVLSRCYEKSGFLSYTNAAQEMFKNRFEHPKPEFLNAYTGQLKDRLTCTMTAKELICAHTMFPYFARFLPCERRKDAMKAMQRQSPDIIDKLGYSVKRGLEKKYLRYCPLCAENDRAKYGEAYWHRKHQLFGVSICPEHRVFLIESPAEISSKSSPGFFSAEECISELEPVECQNDLQIRLAEYVAEVFDAPMDMRNKISVGEFLNSKLAGTPYQSVRGQMRNMALLEHDFREYYAELPDNWFRDLAQLQQLFNGKRSNAVEVCMLGMFLGVETKELTRMKLPKEDRTEEYDRRIAELRSQGLNYRQIAEIVGGSYDYVKAIGETQSRHR